MPADLPSQTLVRRLRVGLGVVLAYAGYIGVLTALRVYWNFTLTPYLAGSTAVAGAADAVLIVLVAVGCLAPRSRRRLAGQEGFALVMALGISVVMMILGTTLAMYTMSSMRSSTDSRQRELAYSASEAGLSAGVAYLNNNASVWHTSTPITVGPVTLGRGEKYTITLTPNYPIWTVKSVGTAPNQTQGSMPDTHVSQRSVRVSAASSGVNISLWNMFFSDAPVGNCLHWNAIVEVPMYVRGDLCVDASGDSDPIVGWPPASLPGEPQLMVGGMIDITPPGHLGYSGKYFNVIQTGPPLTANCSVSGGAAEACRPAIHIDANTFLTGTPNLAKPVIDLAGWYKDALPGPKNPCTSGSFPGGFDNDTTQNNSNGTINLTPAAAYDCIFASGGVVQGEVKWTPGSPGTLLVNGTVFFDGNLVANTSFNYTGRATFYFGGTITLGAGVNVCGISGCTSSWNTNTNMLILVSGSPNVSPSWAVNLNATSKFQGAIEAVGDVNQNGTPSSGSTVQGGIIAHQIYNLSPNDTWANFNLPAAGQPGTTNVSESLTPVASSFSG